MLARLPDRALAEGPTPQALDPKRIAKGACRLQSISAAQGHQTDHRASSNITPRERETIGIYRLWRR
jgi:hypothetical protein